MPSVGSTFTVGGGDCAVFEACEYKKNFLSLDPKIAGGLNIDNDHLDYFKNIDNIQKSFEKYVSQLPEDGYLILNRDDERCYALRNSTKATVVSVGTHEDADWTYKNVTFDDDGFATYDVYKSNEFMGSITLKVAGIHNVFNSLCCVALCDAYGISVEIVAKALIKFTGASRRLEYKGMINGAKVYDDYGHHPTEIMATVNGVKNKKYNESWVVFEAHTYSRLKEHLHEFALALQHFDHIIMIDIYAAREINTYNIHESDLINELKKLGKKALHISNHDEVIDYLSSNVTKGDIIITLGAGNVTKIANKIKEMN